MAFLSNDLAERVCGACGLSFRIPGSSRPGCALLFSGLPASAAETCRSHAARYGHILRHGHILMITQGHSAAALKLCSDVCSIAEGYSPCETNNHNSIAVWHLVSAVCLTPVSDWLGQWLCEIDLAIHGKLTAEVPASCLPATEVNLVGYQDKVHSLLQTHILTVLSTLLPTCAVPARANTANPQQSTMTLPAKVRIIASQAWRRGSYLRSQARAVLLLGGLWRVSTTMLPWPRTLWSIFLPVWSSTRTLT